MSIEIESTPIVTGKSAERLTRMMFANRHKKVGYTPTPKLAELTAKILTSRDRKEK